MFDPQKYKSDFPILQRDFEGKPLVYLDNSATTQKPYQVIDAISDFYETSNANVHRGIYRLSEKATEKYEDVREKVKNFINADSSKEIIFTSGTTESINLIAYSWAEKNLKEGDIILLTDMEHHSNLIPWHILEKKIGIQRKFVPLLENGMLNFRLYVDMVKMPEVKMACFTHVSNVLGTVNPVNEMVEIAKQHNVTTLIDGAQAVPHIKVDIKDIGCDFYAFSGHKMLGPTGIGVLYGRKKLLVKMSPFLSGGEMVAVVRKNMLTYNELPWRFEAGTPKIAEAIGLAAAIDYLQKVGPDNIHMHEYDLTKYAYEQIQSKFDGSVTLYGPSPVEHGSSTRTGVLSFTIEGIHPHDISSIMDKGNICVRSGHHCAQPLINSMAVDAVTRASFYLYNDRSDVDALIEGLAKVRKIFE